MVGSVLRSGLVIALLSIASTAVAVEPGRAQLPDLSYLIKLALALLLVLGLFGICVRLMRRTGALRSGTVKGLEVLAGVSLGGRERLVLVRAQETRILLGVGAAGIVKLHEFDAQQLDRNGAAGNDAELQQVMVESVGPGER